MGQTYDKTYDTFPKVVDVRSCYKRHQ
jgi:hypothetical protein